MNRQIWVGLAEVLPLPGCTALSEGKGAFVHVMAWAKDAAQFRAVLQRNLRQLKLDLVDVRDAMPWEVRSFTDLDEELDEMALSISQDVTRVAFGTFHTWLKDEVAH